MRRLWPTITLFFLAGFVLGASITGVRTDRSSYAINDTARIYWNYSPDISDGKVKIALLDSSDNYLCTIARNIDMNEGSTGYRWTIQPTCTRDSGATETITPGSYRIRVRLMGTTVMNESPLITISSAPSGPTISNVRTDRNRYYFGERARVFWDITGAPSGSTVKIALLNQNRQYVCTLETGVDASEGTTGHPVTFSSTCRRDNGQTETLSPGKYAIRIRLENTEVRSDGSLFELWRGPRTAVITNARTARPDSPLLRRARRLRNILPDFTLEIDVNGELITFSPPTNPAPNTTEWHGRVLAIGSSYTPELYLNSKVTNRTAQSQQVRVCHYLKPSESQLPEHFPRASNEAPFTVGPGSSRIISRSLSIHFFPKWADEYAGHDYTFVFESVVKDASYRCGDPAGDVSPRVKTIIHLTMPSH